MSLGMFILGLVLLVLIAAMSLLVILWAREESRKAVEAPFYERAETGPYSVQLLVTGRRKSAVLRLVRRASPVGLREAYHAVEHPPAIIAEDISREDAEWLMEQLTDHGARARILGG